MAKQTINIGTTANDGTGDPIRAAFGKVNDNFTEIYTANTGVNTGDQNLSAYATTAAVAAGYQPLDSDLTAISALTTTAYGRALLSTADAATLRSAIGVGTGDAPTFLAQTLTGQSLTGVQATSLVDLSATWNTTGNPSLIYGRVTNTNSGASANLIDLGTLAEGSLFSVAKDGFILTPSVGFVAIGSSRQSIGSSTARLGFGTDYIYAQVGNGSMSAFVNSGYHSGRDQFIGWSSNVYPGYSPLSPDVTLFRDASGILAQRNGTNAQAFRVYNSTDATPATNFDRASFGFTSNVLRIGTENGGTYTTARPIEFVTGGVVRMSIAAGGNVGIGIAAPVSILDIRGANGVASAVQIGSLATNIGNFISLHGSATNGAAVRIFSNYWVTEGGLHLGTYSNQSTLCIATGGKVGIGTASPASSLQVKDGDVEVETVTNGIILKAAGTSTRYRLTLNAGGTALVFTAV